MKTKKEMEDRKVTSLARDIGREAREIKKVKEKLPAASGKKKLELEEYVETLEERVMWILESMTKHKIDRANLAQLSKALRIITDKVVKARGGATQVIDHRKINIDVKVKNMSEKKLVELLTQKSRDYDKIDED